MSKAVALSVGGYFGCAVLDTGAVQCWGQNFSGQLGDGTESTSLTAATSVAGISDAIAVATGGAHACALQPRPRAMLPHRRLSRARPVGTEPDNNA